MSLGVYERTGGYQNSWYEQDPRKLEAELKHWLDDVKQQEKTTKHYGFISPHAGYFFSGHVAAYGFHAMEKELKTNARIKRVIVLHPSHCFYTDQIGLCPASKLHTPLGVLDVDVEFLRAV